MIAAWYAIAGFMLILYFPRLSNISDRAGR